MTAAAKVDTLLGGRVRFQQPSRGYRAAIDPVFLAAHCEPPRNGRLLDFGCGAGAASLCLAARRPDLSINGLDNDPEAIAMARSNVAANAFESRVTLHCGDAASPPPALARNSFDAVMMNPPFNDAGRDPKPPNPGKARAHAQPADALADWLDGARRLLRQRGLLSLIYRADRMDLALSALGAHFGSYAVTPLWPKVGAPAKRILISAIKGGKARLSLRPGVVLHGRDGAFTREAEAILRDGQGLSAVLDGCDS